MKYKTKERTRSFDDEIAIAEGGIVDTDALLGGGRELEYVFGGGAHKLYSYGKKKNGSVPKKSR